MASWRTSHVKGNPTIARTLTLTGAVLAALAAGTNYVYSAYAPQLGSRLGLSHTQLNIIGLSGNVGVYSTGPLWGGLVDKRGPRILFLNAVILLFLGYSGIRLFFDGIITLPGAATHTLTPGLVLLALFAFATGAGGNAGLTASLNAAAKSFPDKTRATVAGVVVSGFGLSAFLFSSIAHVAFPDSTSDFLLLLSLGTTLPMILGFFIVRPVLTNPNDRASTDEVAQYAPLRRRSSDYDREHNDVRDPLPSHPRIIEPESNDAANRPSLEDHQPSLPAAHFALGHRRPSHGLNHSKSRGRSVSPSSSLDLLAADFGAASPGTIEPHTFLRHPHDLTDITEDSRSESENGQGQEEEGEAFGQNKPEVDIHGWGLAKTADFWILFSILSCLAGTGLMWINNVGSIAQALVAEGQPDNWDQARAAKLQAAQVSIVSLTNCSGRLIIGMLADFSKHRFSIRRTTWLIPISALFIISQYLALHVTAPGSLWWASATLGLAYGSVFSLCPVITLEWFGMTCFSSNWGYVSLSPVLGGNILSLAFGKNLDKHAAASLVPRAVGRLLGTIGVRRGGASSDLQCFEGPACYAESLYLTMGACTMALGLAIVATLRDKKRHKAQLALDGEEGGGLLAH